MVIIKAPGLLKAGGKEIIRCLLNGMKLRLSRQYPNSLDIVDQLLVVLVGIGPCNYVCMSLSWCSASHSGATKSERILSLTPGVFE